MNMKCLIPFLLCLTASAQTRVQPTTCAGTAPSVNCTFSVNITAGDAVVVSVGYAAFAGTSTVTDSAGDVFNNIFHKDCILPCNSGSELWICVSSKGGTATVNVANIAGIINVIAVEYDRYAQNIGNQSQNGKSSTQVLPSLTVPGPNNWLIATGEAQGATGGWTLSPSAGWSAGLHVASGGADLWYFDQVYASFGTYNLTMTAAGGGDYVTSITTFAPDVLAGSQAIIF